MLSEARTITLATAVIQAAGFGKTLLIAYLFGAAVELDGYYLALVLPSLLVSILAGSLQGGFVATYVSLHDSDGGSRADELASQLFVRAVGADMVMPQQFLQAGPIAEIIEATRPTVSGAVPTVLNDVLVNQPDADLSSLRYVICGGSAVPTPTQGPVSGEPAFTGASKLTTIGLDELFFGDPVEFAAEVASTTWTGLPPEDSRPQCYTVQPASGPVGIYFTVMDGFIERVDITNPIITTRSGAGVGSSEADLVELFGDSLEVEEIPGGRQITFVPTDASDRSFRIIWVTDGQFVVSMRAGRTAIVTPWAPCS